MLILFSHLEPKYGVTHFKGTLKIFKPVRPSINPERFFKARSQTRINSCVRDFPFYYKESQFRFRSNFRFSLEFKNSPKSGEFCPLEKLEKRI